MKNISNSTIKVVWDEAAYIDYNGETSKIMHKGIKYSEREASQPASVIIKGAKLEDVAIPTKNVSYSSSLNDWVYLYSKLKTIMYIPVILRTKS